MNVTLRFPISSSSIHSCSLVFLVIFMQNMPSYRFLPAYYLPIYSLLLISSLPFFPHRWLPLAKLVNVPDVNVVMAAIAAALMDNHREQLIGIITVISISL